MATEMSPDEIAQILEAIHKLDCAAVEVTVGDVRIVVRRDSASERPDAAAATVATVSNTRLAGGGAQGTASNPPAGRPGGTGRLKEGSQVATQQAAESADEVSVWAEREQQGQAYLMRAPMIGTFYRARAPGEAPFVEIDSSVSKGDTVGLVEAMKLFNSILADFDGKVAAIFAADGELVEYGQPVLAVWKQ